MSGKGSAPRPYSVDQDTFGSNWEQTFMGRSSTGEQASLKRSVVGSNPTAPATSHTVALIRMGSDGKITYGGEQSDIHTLINKLKRSD